MVHVDWTKPLATQSGMTNKWFERSRAVVCQRTVGTSITRYGAVAHGKRLVRPSLLGGVGDGGEIPPATRFGHFFL
jgi:hypothetical protein